MTTPPVGVERRVGQRFPYLLPLSLRQPADSIEGVGFTQDLCSRGVFFFTNAPLTPGAEIEITLRMPSEITLGESMPVRCRGRILRVIRPSANSTSDSSRTQATIAQARIAEAKIGVAVRLECYEYLPESSQSSASFPRVSSLHQHRDEDEAVARSSARPVLG
jgi:PilZ domain